MEKISAACAMEWSIELDKALRSKKPGVAAKGILEFGPRLQQWDKDPQPTMGVYNMFGLVPGEDRLFANAILLRLADAFKYGDRDTRLAVVKVFLSERRSRGKTKKNKQYKGILSKDRVPNHSELLKRVEIVFDTGDAESRALSLVLFGCWADFAKDSAHIRYLILSSLVSEDMSEVQASLFAAGCFSELANDFASVTLEMLVNVITSSEASLTLRLAGARIFAKMGCSYSIATRAYKAGLNVVLDSSDEDFWIAMLVSLTKIASKSTLLLAELVNLLLSCLGQMRTSRLQKTAIKCLHFMFVGGVSHSHVGMDAIKMLLGVVCETELPSAMQCQALKILRKMLLCRFSTLPCEDMLDVGHVFTVIKNSTQSTVMPKKFLAIRVLADVSMMLKGRDELDSGGELSTALPLQIISIIIDQIMALVKPLLDCCQASATDVQDFRTLLDLLLLLVGEHQDLGALVLEKLRLFVEYLIKQEGMPVDEVLDYKGKKSVNIRLKLVHVVHKFCATCIESLNEAGSISTQILEKIKLLVDCVSHCGLFDWYTRTVYSVLYHSHITWGCVVNKNKEWCLERIMDEPLYNDLVEQEIFSLGCAKKMLTERSNWLAYKAGLFAVLWGSWVTAAFIFEQLTSKVQSESCSGWLRSLAEFAQSERNIQLLLSSKLRSGLAHWSDINEFPSTVLRGSVDDETGRGAVWSTNEPKLLEMLFGACRGLFYARERLKSISTPSEPLYFQRWFLDLRAKVLGSVVDIFEVLDTIPLNLDSERKDVQVERSFMLECVNSLQRIIKLAFRLKMLAQELDLIAISFIGVDNRSSKIISTLALSCSLLAFTTGFPLYFSNLPCYEILVSCAPESSKNCSQAMLIQNLAGRLWLIDQETCINLCQLSEVGVQPMQKINKMLNSGGKVRDILDICNFAVSSIGGLQNEAKGMQNEMILTKVTKEGLQILSNTLTKWMCIPFLVPEYFFKVRPHVGSELFAFSANAQIPNDLVVSSGFHLSLNLCLQLRNFPPNPPIQVTKLYCILCTSVAFREPKPGGEVQLDYGACETSKMVEMNERLFDFVKESAKEPKLGKRGRSTDVNNDDGCVMAFVYFELNDSRGRGFSDCLLDVSQFPEGTYRIKWHSGLIDSQGSYWSILPLNSGPVFTVQKLNVE